METCSNYTLSSHGARASLLVHLVYIHNITWYNTYLNRLPLITEHRSHKETYLFTLKLHFGSSFS